MRKYKLINHLGNFNVGATCFRDEEKNLNFKWENVKAKELYNVVPDDFTPETIPDYWQEIIKVDYQILQFKDNCKQKIFHLTLNGKYSLNKDTSNATFHLNDILNAPGNVMTIHQVKCISTGEILTVGDNTNIGIIDKFEISEYNLMWGLRTNIICVLKHLKKVVRKSLFKTLDGKEIFDGDSFFFIVDRKIIERKVDVKKEFYDMKNIFSTKQAAEDWLVENTPVLSLKEINDVLEKGVNWEVIKQDLKYITKEKLKINQCIY